MDGGGALVEALDLSGLTFEALVDEADTMADWAAAGLMDIDLSFLSFLELYRTDVAERRMTTLRVVEPLDVVKHIGAGLFPEPVHLSGRAPSLQ